MLGIMFDFLPSKTLISLSQILDDPRGSAFVENPSAPELDKYLKIVRYDRSEEQNTRLGLTPGERDGDEGAVAANEPPKVNTFRLSFSLLLEMHRKKGSKQGLNFGTGSKCFKFIHYR